MMWPKIGMRHPTLRHNLNVDISGRHCHSDIERSVLASMQEWVIYIKKGSCNFRKKFESRVLLLREQCL
jgi:hypothetical protein